jgi:chromosome segregation ATPase
MPIENVMYFALGLLVAGLLALIIMPSVWKRAVRLTKRRIEAATPITMAEFRADKDQLRAEFALSTRRLEMNVEALRKRLAEQLGDVNQKRSDLGALKAERDQHVAANRELERRETELRARILELERHGTALSEQLAQREQDAMQSLAEGGAVDGGPLSGDYSADIARLSAALAMERQRAGFLQEQAEGLLARLESSDRRSVETNAAIAQMRGALASQDESKAEATDGLIAAEARMASAESRLNAILAQTSQVVEKSESRVEALLADKLSLEAEVEALRKTVNGVESAIIADWDGDRLEQAYLREKLNDIAASVSRLVYAVDTDTPVERNDTESLFDRVQRFADDGEEAMTPPVAAAQNRRGSVSDRMAALREIQER